MKTKNNSQEEFAKNDGVEFPDTKSLKEKEQIRDREVDWNKYGDCIKWECVKCFDKEDVAQFIKELIDRNLDTLKQIVKPVDEYDKEYNRAINDLCKEQNKYLYDNS